MSVLGIVKVTEGKALRGLLSRLSATSWSYAPATSLRLQEGTLLPQPQTLSEDSIPTPSAQASSEVSCLHEVGPSGNRQYRHVVKGLGLAGAPHGPQPTPPPAQDPDPQPPPWGLTPQNPLPAAFFPFIAVMCVCPGFL